MTQSTNQARRSESGFTLVELAIVMIIIGLLIGGILKGQELINNARVSSTVAQVKAIESGISGFRDKYATVPGDFTGTTASTRLPACTAGLCNYAGNGDGSIGASGTGTFDPGSAIVAASESAASFVQLAAAGMIGGVSASATALNVATAPANPSTPLGGFWALATSTGAAGTGLVGPTATPATVLQSGAYVALVPTPGAVADGSPLTPVQAGNIDRKLDDGQPNTGIVRATGAGTATGCASATGVAGVYNEALPGTLCGLYAKVM